MTDKGDLHIVPEAVASSGKQRTRKIASPSMALGLRKWLTNYLLIAPIFIGCLFLLGQFQKAVFPDRGYEAPKEDHCFSPWDGSYDKLVDEVTKSLRDPSSFQHVETRATKEDSTGQRDIMMTFRAANGFGGLNVGMATATFRQDSCGLVTWNIVKS